MVNQSGDFKRRQVSRYRTAEDGLMRLKFGLRRGEGVLSIRGRASRRRLVSSQQLRE